MAIEVINVSLPNDGNGDTLRDANIICNNNFSFLDINKADKTLTISTSAPLQGGGDLSANRTLSMTQAGSGTNGYLSSTDWNTFNNKQGTISGTLNRIPKFAVGSGVTDSAISDDGDFITIDRTAGPGYLSVKGISDGDNFAALELNDRANTSKWQFASKSDKSFIFNHNNGTSWSAPLTIASNGVSTFANTVRTYDSYFFGNTLNYKLYNNPDNIAVLQQQSDLYSILEIKAPEGDISTLDREATLALTRADDNGAEFLDLYNNGYNDGKQYGIRIQKRGTGQYRDFVIEYSSALSAVTNVMRLNETKISFSKPVLINTNIDNGVDKLQVSGNTKITGNLTATTIVKSGGTSSQFLKADGSVDTNTYQTSLTNPITGVATRTAGYIPKFQGTSTINNSAMQDDGANFITIDRGNTASYLTIKGASDGDNYSSLELASSGNTSRWQFSNKAADKSFQFNHNNGTSWSAPFTITSAGNTLLGTTTDNGVDKLQVSGSINATTGLRHGKAILIPGGSSLDTYTTAGFYDTTSTVMSNKPYDLNELFTLTVERASSGNEVTQIATSKHTGRIYSRFKNAVSTWSPWEVISKRNYKVYTTLLSQTGTDDPIPTELDLDLTDGDGGIITWTRFAAGVYRGTLAGAFPAGKTVCFLNLGNSTFGSSGVALRLNDDVIQINTIDSGGSGGDIAMTNASLEVRVYQ